MPDHRPPLTQIPAEILCARDYVSLAAEFLPAPLYAYIEGGSGDDLTAQANLAAFSALQFCPRVLQSVAGSHTRIDLPGVRQNLPILLAPVAYQSLVHPRGELDTARAAAAMGCCMVASTLSSFTLEDIGREAGARWFQLYFQASRTATLQLVRRAEAAGYTALMVTVDAQVQWPSHRALRAGFQLSARAANLPDVPPTPVGKRTSVFDAVTAAPVWADITWLLEQTSIPVWIKGVLHPEDAIHLRDLGAAGVVVSNHGGRTVDGAAASLTQLPIIRAAVGAGFPLLLDSGIRSGADIAKAVMLGADAVMVGRLQVYALAVAGALGVAHMLRCLSEELEACMVLTGAKTLTELRNRSLLPNPGGPDAHHPRTNS